jgi:hypothetical protein
MGGSSSAWEALRPHGRLFVRVGGASSAWEALRPRERRFVRVAGPSSAWKALPRRRSFLRRVAASSAASQLPPPRRSFLPRVAAPSGSWKAPPTRARSRGRAHEACSPRLLPRRCRSTVPQPCVRTHRSTAYRKTQKRTARAQGRRCSADPIQRWVRLRALARAVAPAPGGPRRPHPSSRACGARCSARCGAGRRARTRPARRGGDRCGRGWGSSHVSNGPRFRDCIQSSHCLSRAIPNHAIQSRLAVVDNIDATACDYPSALPHCRAML